MTDFRTWTRSHSREIDTAVAVVLTVGSLLLLAQVLLGPRNLDVAYIQGIVPLLVAASQISFFATAVSFLLGMVIGFFIGWAKTVRPAPPVVGERPTGVIVLSVVFIALAVADLLTIAGSTNAAGPGFAGFSLPAIISASTAGGYLVAAVGLWALRRWGWGLAVAVNLADAASSIAIGSTAGFSAVTTLAAAIVPLIVILYLFIAAGAFGIEVPLLARGANRVIRRVAEGYVELMRGTPLFVQIVFVWSILVFKAPTIPRLALTAGILAMTINTGAYQGEIFRGGLQTVHPGQVEAARAVGLSRWQTMRHIVLPQALRLIIPPLTNEFIALFKASSLLFFIGVNELTGESKFLSFREVRIFEVFVVVTGIYLLITVPLSNIIQALERRLRIPGLGIQVTREERLARAPA